MISGLDSIRKSLNIDRQHIKIAYCFRYAYLNIVCKETLLDKSRLIFLKNSHQIFLFT